MFEAIRNRRSRRAGLLAALVLGFLNGSALPASRDPGALARDYARAYEVELGSGTLSEATELYRKLLPEAMATTNQALAGKILFRLGSCEREMGRISEARQAWKRLMGILPADHPLVLRTRRELKDLERELDHVTVRGRIVDDRGQPVADAYVIVGDWGSAPPAISATDGTFSVDRQAAGRLADGSRYCLIYAEHSTLPLAMAGIWDESVTAKSIRSATTGERVSQETGGAPQKSKSRSRAGDSVDFPLRPAFALSGFVVDPNGRPVSGAMLHITGLADRFGEVPLPMGNLFPSLASDSNGQFRVTGLAEGLNYGIVAEKEGYRQGRCAVDAAVISAVRDMEGPGSGLRTARRTVHAPEIVLQRIGRIFIDDGGMLRAEVNLNDPVERKRLDEVVAAYKSEGSKVRTSWSEPATEPVATVFPFSDFPFALRWLHGDPVTGGALRLEDVKDRVMVYHFSSVYLDASLKSQFPHEPGILLQINRLYGHHGVVCVWLIPPTDETDDAVRLALETCPDTPIAVDREGLMWKALGVTGYGGNVVVDRKGKLRAPCSDLQVLRVIKDALADDERSSFGDAARMNE